MRAALLLLVLAACTRSPAPSRAPAPSESAAASASPSATLAHADASVALPPEDVGPPPPLPPAPPGADPEKVKLAASICAAATFTHPLTKTLEVGCRSHPPFDLPEQKPDGKLPPFTDDPLRLCILEKVYKGSFSRPGAKQAALSFSQCKENDPNATWDMGFPGSMVLVEEVAGRWKAIRYELGVNTSACLQSRRTDGRDVLLCRSGLGAGSAGEVIYFFAVDFALSKKTVSPLAKMFSNAFTCGQQMLDWEHGLVALRVADVRLSDVNKDGTPDLVFQVTRARAAPSATLEARVHASCKQMPNADAAPILPPAKKTTLELLSNADGFAPSPSTKTALDDWQSEAPDGFNGLSQVVPQ